MRVTQTIAFRLFLLIASLQVVILTILAIISINIQQQHLMENVVLSAQRVSDVIARSTRYSMLLNRKEDVHEIINSIGGERGLEGIRIYNKQGTVIFGTSPGDLHTTVDMDAEACVSCHGENGLGGSHPPASSKLSRIFSTTSGDRVLGLITPIRNEDQCAGAPCHAHPQEKTILGVLDVKMSLAQADDRIGESARQLILLSSCGAFLTALVSGIFIWIILRRPVRLLMTGMEKVAGDDLRHRVVARTNNEFGQLSKAFNTMTSELEKAKNENEAWSNTLEERVREKTNDLNRLHGHLLRIEKMASLGNLASTVAHELNNPLEGILTFARLSLKRIDKLTLDQEKKEPLRQDLQLLADESLRCGNIVKNLLSFSRRQGSSFRNVHVREILDKSLLLMNHHAELKGVRLSGSCTAEGELYCDPGEIQQLLMALIMNGIEAVTASASGDTGSVSVRIEDQESGKGVTVEVLDTGVGMTEEVKANMFEPFFTTKSDGRGVGLGLAVVYGIVSRHQGSIDVVTSPGKGTTISVVLPLRQKDSSDEQHAVEGKLS